MLIMSQKNYVDGYQLERSAVDTPTVTHSVVEVRRRVNDQQESSI